MNLYSLKDIPRGRSHKLLVSVLVGQSHVRRGQKAQYCIPGNFCMAQNVMVNANRLATMKIRTIKISIFR